jgi:hypothetical protein
MLKIYKFAKIICAGILFSSASHASCPDKALYTTLKKQFRHCIRALLNIKEKNEYELEEALYQTSQALEWHIQLNLSRLIRCYRSKTKRKYYIDSGINIVRKLHNEIHEKLFELLNNRDLDIRHMVFKNPNNGHHANGNYTLISDLARSNPLVQPICLTEHNYSDLISTMFSFINRREPIFIQEQEIKRKKPIPRYEEFKA